MKTNYDFSKGKRGRIAPPQPEPQGKTRITIRIDDDLLDYFLKEADKSGGAVGYQTLLNDALRQFMEGKAPKIEDTLRRIVREEINFPERGVHPSQGERVSVFRSREAKSGTGTVLVDVAAGAETETAPDTKRVRRTRASR